MVRLKSPEKNADVSKVDKSSKRHDRSRIGAFAAVGVLCARFRDGFLLAAVIAVSICYLGDAYGHLHQAAIHDNHDPDNTGIVLYTDFIVPLIGLILYALNRRAAGSGKLDEAQA